MARQTQKISYQDYRVDQVAQNDYFSPLDRSMGVSEEAHACSVALRIVAKRPATRIPPLPAAAPISRLHERIDEPNIGKHGRRPARR
jgi:hypothetical protein